MLIMTTNGLNAMLNSQFKFGADAGLTIATLGAGVNGSMSTGLTADILTLVENPGPVWRDFAGRLDHRL